MSSRLKSTTQILPGQFAGETDNFTKEPEDRNRRLSCVFALMRGWMSENGAVLTVFRLGYPFAEKTFPEGLLVADGRMVSRRDSKGVRIEWELCAASPGQAT
jgi:hypothetical protein